MNITGLESGMRIGVAISTSKSWENYVYVRSNASGIVVRDVKANSYVQFIPWSSVERITWKDESND